MADSKGFGHSGLEFFEPASSPCPSRVLSDNPQCLLLQILDHTGIGVILLDLRGKAVILNTPGVFELLSPKGAPFDYEGLCQLLLSSVPEKEKIPEQGLRRILELDDRILGYTVYPFGDGCCILVKDVTQAKRLEAIAEAVNTMENIGYVFSGIRHEMGNPLNSIKLTLEVLMGNFQRFDALRVQSYLERALAEMARIEFLFKSLKSFSMFDKPALEELVLGVFLKNFLAVAGTDLKRRGIRLTEPTADVTHTIVADPRMLYQVLLNVLANAEDALVSRKEKAIALEVSRSDDMVILDIVDNGCGISEEKLQNLFHPFITSKAGGTGLGLVICKKMLTAMQGDIQISSKEGVGTTVRLLFPTERLEPPQ